MAHRTTPLIFLAVLGVLRATEGADNPLAAFTRSWRDDPIWYDGQAEVAIYDATRTIYGTARCYTARLYTNKEHASAETFTKSPEVGQPPARAVFKHHLREDIPTVNYNYHFSTMCYVGTDDLKSLKLDLGSQEDCGATFKQYINHAGKLTWSQFSYFPNQGRREGAYRSSPNLAFHDALSLILRGYPFDNPPPPLNLDILRDQTTNKHSSSEPEPVRVGYQDKETLDLPIGQIVAHHLVLHRTIRSTTRDPNNVATYTEDYWFAADPALLHVMVQYRNRSGRKITYKLRSLQRRAYWRR